MLIKHLISCNEFVVYNVYKLYNWKEANHCVLINFWKTEAAHDE